MKRDGGDSRSRWRFARGEDNQEVLNEVTNDMTRKRRETGNWAEKGNAEVMGEYREVKKQGAREKA